MQVTGASNLKDLGTAHRTPCFPSPSYLQYVPGQVTKEVQGRISLCNPHAVLKLKVALLPQLLMC